MPPISFAGLPRTNVLGVGVHATTLEEAVTLSSCFLQSGARGYVCLTGVHGVMEAQRDAQLQHILNDAVLCLPDGMPTVWVGRAQGHRQMARVYGPDYMLAMCRWLLRCGCRHFLYGGKPGVAEILQQQLQQKLPSLQIVGMYTPPFGELSETQEDELRQRVTECKPDIFWVGLSTPKQERFMAEHVGELDVRLMAGVGAAFDIHAGLVYDSPDWIKSCGLQWLDRLRQEPRRLWRRYLRNNPAFAWEIAMQAVGVRRFGAE
jgi:N-acetylglucosaminyldiphosphoundecaprenol N-acetyl-beta-D-mannosaminyltransferase